MKEETRQEYEKLRKKYELPEYEKFDSEFEIHSIDCQKFLLREIRRKIQDILDYYAKLIEGLLQPDTTITNLYEVKYLSEEKKQDVYNAYRDIMSLFRDAAFVGIYNKEDETAEFIRKVWDKWPGIKKKLREIVRMMRDSWSDESTASESLEYFG